jgi:hypothetical protein
VWRERESRRPPGGVKEEEDLGGGAKGDVGKERSAGGAVGRHHEVCHALLQRRTTNSFLCRAPHPNA